MKYTIKYTDEAKEDINRIYEEVLNACLDHATAKNYLNNLIDKIDLVSDFPDSGSPLYFGSLVSDYRFVIYKSYLAFYMVKDNEIRIIRVLFGRSDYIKKLRIT